jgi:Ca-activated chloride channel family protein
MEMKPLIVLSTCTLTLLLSACLQDQQPLEETTLDSPVVKTEQITVSRLNELSSKPLPLTPKAEFELASSLHPVMKMKQVTTSRFASPGHEKQVLQDINAGHWQSQSNRDVYADISENPVKKVMEEPVSTFSIDVDTGAYAVVRRHLNQGGLPPTDAVRIEELVNYFEYSYETPRERSEPFSVSTEMAPTPWNENTHLLQVGLQGYLPVDEARSAANLVFLIDVSGSMNAADKLPLLKNAFRLLVRQLNSADRITIVVYAGSSGVVLETTPGNKKGDILAALDKLSAGGSTHGSAGIELAYSMVEQAFIKEGINRVILATDGDFNVGTVNHAALLDIIERKKQKGISLTTLGFGSGNYNDHLMEQLADHGDGNYAYIDNLNEARKTLVDQISSTLETIAKDVKIQIEWNPATVSEYRLIGYENRLLKREDFNNDKVDAGEIGAGHSVTALYEITLAHSKQKRIEDLRYQATAELAHNSSAEIAFLKLRYKMPHESRSRLVQRAITRQHSKPLLSSASQNLRFASAVAAFGELLRGGKNLHGFDYADILKLARDARGDDNSGYRGEFLRLVELAQALDSNS